MDKISKMSKLRTKVNILIIGVFYYFNKIQDQCENDLYLGKSSI